ncbi:MAG TPA: Spy/CpxP family protein refolding chaperone [Hyphomicrobiaceae bacterium]|nr:Spy/CpxP family protein refolding chaperone [Hyphomicrobiaceae bacterium]
MNTKALVIGAVAATAMFAGGWALAQSAGPDGFGPSFMRGMSPGFMRGMGHGGMGHGGMGHDMMEGMRDDMGSGHMEDMHHDVGRGTHRRMGRHMEHGPADRADYDPASLDALKAELAITPAQEPAWTKYAKAVQDAATAPRNGRERFDPEVADSMSPADRFARLSKMREQRQTQLEAVNVAAEELRATLDESQKAKAEDILSGPGFRAGEARRGFAGGHGHGHGHYR